MQQTEVLISKEVYLFLRELKEKARNKILYNIDKIRNGVIDKNIFKKLESTDIWEFRTLYEGTHYRIFAFWDTHQQRLIVTTHAIIKKTGKTPLKEIEKAESIRREYYQQQKK